MKKRNIRKGKKFNNKSGYISKKYSIFLIPLRYLILLLLILSLQIIYLIATPLTVYSVNFLLKIFVTTSLSASENLTPLFVLGNKTLIEIVPACIAGSAYLLILMLNLSIPMSLKKRIYSIGLSALILLLFNILRITFFSLLYHYKTPYIDFTHMLFWYVISTVFVVGLWFLNVRIFKIKEIPVYSDLKYIYQKIKHK